jgi:hypothetical protein
MGPCPDNCLQVQLSLVNNHYKVDPSIFKACGVSLPTGLDLTIELDKTMAIW